VSVFTFKPSVNNEEIFRLAHSVNSAVFIVADDEGETLIIVPNSRKRVVQCRDLHEAMTQAKIEEDLASRPAVFAISIQTLSRDLRHLKFFAEAIDMRIVAIDAPGENISLYFVKHRQFDGEIIWVKPDETKRLRDLIS